jgi:hypothetical protein
LSDPTFVRAALKESCAAADARGEMSLARCLTAAVLGLAVLAPAASASCECGERDFSPVFSAFDDQGLYTLAPDGDFEDGAAGWSLDAGAVVVPESSPILLGSSLGAASLELAPGASAVTPAICVENGFRTFRLVARSSGAAGGELQSELLYGVDQVKHAGWDRPGFEWDVTRRLSLAQGRFLARGDGSGTVRIRFTAHDEPVRIDDVYVDPRFRG